MGNRISGTSGQISGDVGQGGPGQGSRARNGGRARWCALAGYLSKEARYPSGSWGGRIVGEAGRISGSAGQGQGGRISGHGIRISAE
ncbi:hypothetical protein Dimus_005903 [Dionaea muscipula]